MSRIEALKKLEGVLESFLERAIKLKEDRVDVLDGINRLDDIALGIQMGNDLSEEVGDWFAEHSDWLAGDRIRPADRNRIGRILGEIQGELDHEQEGSPATDKIRSEIGRWQGEAKTGRQKLVLKRGPETAPAPTDKTDTISLFSNTLSGLRDIFTEVSGNKVHLLSVLDEALKRAQLQSDKQALILSGLIIYYLKQESYKVEPYVKRLKDAERLIKGAH